MSYTTIAVAILFLGWLAWANARSGRAGARGPSRLVLFYSIACSILATVGILLVIAPRVPSSAKDGLFGGVGGLLFGVIMFNAAFSGRLMGILYGQAARQTEPPKQAHENTRA